MIYQLPLVTIGMPVFNGERFISCALKSLLSQTHKNIEIIISNNCSTDRTYEICEDFAATDSRIKVVTQECNIGATANFNFVLSRAEGQYFMWGAHDDLWDEKYIENLLIRILADSALSFVYGRSIFIDENNKECGRAINNFFSHQWFRNDRKNPDILNSVVYYLDRSPFKIYGLFRTTDIKKFQFSPFLGSARQADNVLLLKFLSVFEAEECVDAIHYYRVISRPAVFYAEDHSYRAHTHFRVELEFFKILIQVLFGRLKLWIILIIPILPVFFVGALIKPRAIITKHWLFSTLPNLTKSLFKAK